MTAPTIAVDWLLARAAVRATGLLHLVTRRDSGALNPVCGANPIRSREIDTPLGLEDVALLCESCGAIAASLGGTVADGVAMILGRASGQAVVRLLDVPLAAVRAGREHPRREPGDVDGLVESIRQRGIVSPLIARRIGSGFELIDGARRLWAAHLAGRATVPVLVRDATDADALLDALVANLHRAELNPIEQAHAYTHALSLLACSKAELGRRLGLSRSQISNTIRLLELDEADQVRVAAGELTAQAGRGLLAGPRPVTAVVPEVADLLAALLTAKVRVTRSAERSRIVIDVPDADLARVLEQLGAPAAAA